MSTSTSNPVSPGDVLRSTRLPQSREAEMALLGSMLIQNDLIGDVVEIIRVPDMFAFSAHQLIFQTIQALHLQNRPVDLVVLKDALQQDRQLQAAGGLEYLVSIVESTPDVSSALTYAETVQEKYVLRKIITTCSGIIRHATEVTENVDDIRQQAERALFEVLAKGEKGTIQPLNSITADCLERIFNANGHSEQLLGISTGFYDLDNLLGGLQPGHLYVVAARPSMGKTSLAMSILDRASVPSAGTTSTPALFFSLEMAAQQIGHQMLCARARVDSCRVRKGMFTAEERQKLLMVGGELGEAKIFVDDSADLEALEIRTRARRLKARENIGLVVVDYLQKMHARRGGRGPESRQLEISMISSHLKAMAKELNVPVLALAQLNRAPEGREGRKPLLSDLRESGAIEQDADVVMLMYRDEYYNPDTDKKNICEVNVAKNRTGPTGSIELAFLREFTRFENLAAQPAACLV